MKVASYRYINIIKILIIIFEKLASSGEYSKSCKSSATKSEEKRSYQIEILAYLYLFYPLFLNQNVAIFDDTVFNSSAFVYLYFTIKILTYLCRTKPIVPYLL